MEMIFTSGMKPSYIDKEAIFMDLHEHKLGDGSVVEQWSHNLEVPGSKLQVDAVVPCGRA